MTMSHVLAPDYGRPFLFPPALEDWVPADHPVRFLREFVDQLDQPALHFVLPAATAGRPPYAPLGPGRSAHAVGAAVRHVEPAGAVAALAGWTRIARPARAGAGGGFGQGKRTPAAGDGASTSWRRKQDQKRWDCWAEKTGPRLDESGLPSAEPLVPSPIRRVRKLLRRIPAERRRLAEPVRFILQ